MLTAHLPSGYCLAKSSGLNGYVFAAAVIGAVCPDLDIFFFYFVDDRSIHHHRFWVHIPFFWLVVAGLVLPLLWRNLYWAHGLAFFAGIVLHLLLDSIGGGIMWLAPFDTRLFELVTVSPTHSHWIWSFVLHWTFVLEIIIWVAAGLLYLKGRTN